SWSGPGSGCCRGRCCGTRSCCAYCGCGGTLVVSHSQTDIWFRLVVHHWPFHRDGAAHTPGHFRCASLLSQMGPASLATLVTTGGGGGGGGGGGAGASRAILRQPS